VEIRYSTNWMGPINMEWINKNGRHWAGGRLDFWNPTIDSHYPDELGVPIMHAEDWHKFSDWLDEFRADRVLSLTEIVSEYEKTNPAIRWWKEQE
jgi:hypothetical protein